MKVFSVAFVTCVLPLSFATAEPAPPNGPPRPSDRPGQPDAPRGPLLERAFNHLDADGDGSISKDEFMRAMPELIQRIQEQRGQQRAFAPGQGDGRPPLPPEAAAPGGENLPQEVQRLIDRKVEEAIHRMMEQRGGSPGGPDRRGLDGPRMRRRGPGPGRSGGTARPEGAGSRPPGGDRARPDGFRANVPPEPGPDRPPLGGPRPGGERMGDGRP